MFRGQSQLAALKRYAAIDTSSRVEGASPHQLVRILYDELLLAMDAAAVALRARDRHQTFERQTRALTILHVLETSLDFQRGGDIAPSLATVYRETRRRLLEATATNDPAELESAHAFIADIADAWNHIAPRAAA